MEESLIAIPERGESVDGQDASFARSDRVVYIYSDAFVIDCDIF
jgi:hypothetical protein